MIDRLIEAVQKKLPYDALLNFIKRLRNNPSRRANQDLYEFLEVNKMALLPDGRVLAYKIVRANYLDVHSSSFDNTPGTTVPLPRQDVDDDPDRTCSTGLHVCSPAYLPHFGASCNTRVVVLCAVDPADFVSFPRDYNLSKARVSKYEVLCAISKADLANLDARIGSDWRFQIDYQSVVTYPFLAEFLGKQTSKFKKLRKAVAANLEKIEAEAVNNIGLRADFNLWKGHNS